MGPFDAVLHRHHIRDVTPGRPGIVTIPTPISLVPRAIGISLADSASPASYRGSHRGRPRSPAFLTTSLPIDETPSLSARTSAPAPRASKWSAAWASSSSIISS